MSEPRPNRGDSSKGTVVVVVDDPSMCRSLTRLFTAAGLEAESFDSAGAFLARGTTEGPVCLVLDQRLPGVTGLELQETLVRQGGSASVVFLTAHGDVELSVEAMKAGAVDFLRKPFEGTRLLDTVRAALEKSAAAFEERSERDAFLARVALLTPREREVARHVAQGLLNKQIAAELGITERDHRSGEQCIRGRDVPIPPARSDVNEPLLFPAARYGSGESTRYISGGWLRH